MNVKQNVTLLRTLMNSKPGQSQMRSEIRRRVVAGWMLAVCALVLTVLNIVNHYTFMTYTTLLLTLGMAAAAVTCKITHNLKTFDIIAAAVCCIMFTIYALTGENDGFAILWILLMPLMGLSIFSLRFGVMVCLYFLILLIAIFYTPLRGILPVSFGDMAQRTLADVHGYTPTFMIRFPLLYLCDCCVSLILAFQRQYYYERTDMQAHSDLMTGLSNRNQYNEYMARYKDRLPEKDFAVIAMDMNGLKQANDTYGHEAGDAMLIAVSDYMRACFKENGLICRTGGDEFVILTRASRERVTEMIEVFRRTSGKWEGPNGLRLNMSIGCAFAAEHPDQDALALARIADSECYVEKRKYYESRPNDRRHRD